MPKNQLNDILEIVTFIKDNVPMRDEVLLKKDAFNFATKVDLERLEERLDVKLGETENRLMNHIDKFAKNQNDFRDDLKANNKRLLRVEAKVFP